MTYIKTRLEYPGGGGYEPYALGGNEINAQPNLPVQITVAHCITEYMLDGSRIIGETVKNSSGVEQYRLTYLYDGFDGLPVGMQYRTPSMGQDVWYTYWFEKNLQGDIVAVYYQDGTKILSYTYDAWGNCTQTTHLSTGNYLYAQYNPFRYRGYYFDTTTGYYYLQSRYYNPGWGRFLNADSVLDGIGGELLGYNVFIYCMNDPVNFSDHEGDWPKWATKVLVAVVATVAAITVATAGAGTAVAAIAVGAAKGAVIGAVTGAATGAATGAVKHRLSTGSWEGTGEAALDGMGNGALSGAITGAIAGGISGGVNYIRTNASATNRGFDTFQQLKKDIGSPGAGNEWHHIVEQNQIQKSGFSPRMIHNTNNIRAVPCQTHRAISGYYSSKQVFTNGMTVRNWLAGQSFSAQYDFGLSVLKMFL